MNIIANDMTLRHRVTVSMPMAVLGLIDNAVSLLTFAYVQPGMSLRWGFRGALRGSRRKRR